MSNEGFKGFRPTEVQLAPAGPEKKEAANDQGLEGFSAEELKYVVSRISNYLPPWAEDFTHPVFQNMPPDLVEDLKAAGQPVWDIKLRDGLVKKLDNRWDELDALS